MEQLAEKASLAKAKKAEKAENKVSNEPEVEVNEKRMAEIIQLPIQLPIWPDKVRGVPNSILRSALFGIVRRGRRMYVEERKMVLSQA